MKPVKLLSSYEISKMRLAGLAAAELLSLLGSLVRPGITTQHLDDAAVSWAIERGIRHGPLGYLGNSDRPFPRSICTSVNNSVCHEIPSVATVLKSGDIINIDVTPVVDGWFGDTSETFPVDSTTTVVTNLIRATKECLAIGIAVIKPGNTIGDIGFAIQEHAKEAGFGIIKTYCGHGIGRDFHTSPTIPHFGLPGKGARLETGMCFTVEPMLVIGNPDSFVDVVDGWTVRTTDGSWSAQAEHTVVVTEAGVEILTLPKSVPDSVISRYTNKIL